MKDCDGEDTVTLTEQHSVLLDMPVRLGPTTHLIRTPTRVIIHAGGDDFIVPDLDPPQLDALADVLDGRLVPREVLSVFPAEDLCAVLDELAAEGIIGSPRDTSSAAVPDPCTMTARVVGDNPISAAVIGILQDTGATVTGSDATRSDVIVACTGWLPDRRWSQLDWHCQQQAVPWHRCYGDGRSFFLGPFTIPGVTAGYLDTRRRQLAATDSSDLLEALWAHLDQVDRDFRWPDPGVTALLAGALVADVLSAHRTGTAPSSGYQLELHVATLQWTRHPVLPVPTDLMTGPAS